MKKILLLLPVLFISINAKSIEMNLANPTPSRVTPSESSEILSFSTALKNSMNSVVNIKSIQDDPNSQKIQELMRDPYFRRYFSKPDNKPHGAIGSGVILSRDGYIVTNNHVVENSSKIVVTLPNDTKEYDATLIGSDKDSDLAVIKIDTDDLEPIKIGSSENLKVGDVVFAVGNPFGVGETVTQGIVSALNKNRVGINQYENFIQTDASINPGNSGGALVDSRGVLVGINSAILSRSGGNNGIGFAIPSAMVKRVVSSLVSEGKVTRGYLGVSISDLNTQLKPLYKHDVGAVIIDVEENSPAFKYGFKRGDLIYMIDGKDVKDASSLKQIVASLKPKDEISFYVERDKKDLELSTVLGSRASLSKNTLDKVLGGLKLSQLDKNSMQRYRLPVGTQGVLIEDVYPRSDAEKVGFQAGDVIIQIEDKATTTMSELRDVLDIYNGMTKRVYVNRYGNILMFVTK